MTGDPLASIWQALAAYRGWNPAGWVSVWNYLPVWAGLLLVLGGGAVLSFGGGRAFRLVAGPIGAAAGFLWIPAVVGHFWMEMPDRALAIGAAGGLGILGLFLPVGALFFAFGLPAGLLAGQLAGQADWILGFFPAFVTVGVTASMLRRWVGALASAITGAWLLCLGVLAALAPLPAVGSAVNAQPWIALGSAAVLALLGAGYQLIFRMPPEEADAERLRAERAKARAREREELERRWANYSGHGD